MHQDPSPLETTSPRPASDFLTGNPSLSDSRRSSLGRWVHSLGRARTRCLNAAFHLRENCLLSAFGRTRMHLWFSPNPDWEPAIRRSFRFTPHQIRFGPLGLESADFADLVVPLTLEDTLSVSLESRARGTSHPLAAAPEKIALCNNKHVLNETLRNLGFGDIIPECSPELRPPYVLKKKIDQWGRNTRIIRNEYEEGRAGLDAHSDEYFRQRIVPGEEEYASHILMREGRILVSVTVRLKFAADIFVYGRDGLRPRDRTLSGCAHLALFERLLGALGFEGLCCIDYKVWKKQAALFEINPRFGASLAPYFYSLLRHLRGTPARDP